MGRRRFSREFKLEAVRLVTAEGHSVTQVARDLDIRPDMLRRWRKQIEADGAGAFPGIGRMKPEEEKVRRLGRDLKRVRQERDILKKALAIFSDRRR
jgi:transposase